MEPRAHHILIGFFTLAVAVGAMLFALWLTHAGSQRDARLYDIVFTESVTGLSVGNAVHYNGIRMGEVVNLSLDPQDPRKVWARIRIADSTPVTKATRARLTMANITGTAIIQLVSGPPDSPPLVGKEDQIPVIRAEPSPFTQLRTSSEELLVNISSLVNNASKVLSEENSAHLSNILVNLDTTTSAFAEQKDAISTGIGELAEASREIRTTLGETTRLLGNLNQSYEAHGAQLFANIDRTVTAIEQLSGRLDALVSDNQAALTEGINGFAEIGPAIEELRETLDRLNNIARDMEENPGNYLLGGEHIQEYRP